MPKQLKFLLSIYLLGIIVFTALRFVLLVQNNHYLTEIVNPTDLIYKSLLIGLQYDTVTMCYILTLPLLLFIVTTYTKKANWLNSFNLTFLNITFQLALIIAVADIPYFKHNFSRFDIAALNWIGNPKEMVLMIVSEPTFLVFLLAFVVVAFLLIWLFKILHKKIILTLTETKNNLKTGLLYFAAILLCFMGIRGRIDAPIRTDIADFCNNS